jgi:ubiquinol-cytochrome c reductase cytochrome b subunit
MKLGGRLVRALDTRIRFSVPLHRTLKRIFPTPWSFLLGEVTLFSFVGTVLSGVYLALFFDPSISPARYHGAYALFAGRMLPSAFASVLDLSVAVPFGLVARRFHHFAVHLFLASLVLHAARVYFTGAFRRPRDVTWWAGLGLLALALVNGFTGYCLPFDVRGGTALRMMMTTVESVPWIGGWLASLVFGAPFPGPFILGRLYIEHVFLGPALIAAFLAAHLWLIVRLTHTDYPGPGRSERIEVGARLWPEQTARSTSLMFMVFGWTALLSAFFPVEAVQVYGPFQSATSYPPLEPDWFLMWVEGAFRLIPRQLNFHLLGANFTNPFYGALVLPVIVFASCAIYPQIDARIYGQRVHAHHVLEGPTERPFRTAFGVSGLSFLVFLSLGALDDWAASRFNVGVATVDHLWGILALALPLVLFGTALVALRALRLRARASEPSSTS